SIAKVSESTRYDIKECQLKGSAFTGFVLDSFETQGDFDQWASSGSGLTLAWGAPSTPQSIFYGYVHAKHLNKLVNQNFLYDVHYLTAPPHFRGNRSDFYKGELSFWFKPDERFYTQNLGTVCVPFFLFGQICLPGLVADDDPVVGGDFRVRVVDDVTTFDQVVLRGGDPPFAVLTLTYNPKDNDVPLSWKRHGIPLTNDALLNSTCDRNDPVRRGCWLIEDQVAGEEQIKYVLAKVTDFRIRASYPLQRKVCVDSPAPVPPAVCATRDFVPFGYVGGFVDEVKLNKSAL
ncbi:MAG: hypothetical protein JNL30_06800, partial [Rubrivivax sp.]|nr:hypothetical protein [Rubrivivax sp.]